MRHRNHAFKRAMMIVIFCSAIGAWKLAVADAPNVPAWATSQLNDWFAAYNSRDANALARFYADAAVLRPFGKAPIRGQAAIREHFKQGLASDSSTCTGGFSGFKAAGDVAVGWGYDVCTTQCTGARYDARWMLIWERNAMGRWTIAQDIDEGP
jgi:ketosteroid isomerase-like protein